MGSFPNGIVLTPEAVVVETLVPAVVIPWSGLREIHTFHLRWGWGPLDPLSALAGMQWYLEHPEDGHRLATLAGLTPFGL